MELLLILMLKLVFLFVLIPTMPTPIPDYALYPAQIMPQFPSTKISTTKPVYQDAPNIYSWIQQITAASLLVPTPTTQIEQPKLVFHFVQVYRICMVKMILTLVLKNVIMILMSLSTLLIGFVLLLVHRGISGIILPGIVWRSVIISRMLMIG